MRRRRSRRLRRQQRRPHARSRPPRRRTPWVARAFPITVDGLVLAALRRGDDGRRWLALGLAVSVAANILADYPTIATDAGPIISAIPPLALYGTHRLLHSDGPDPQARTAAPAT